MYTHQLTTRTYQRRGDTIFAWLLTDLCPSLSLCFREREKEKNTAHNNRHTINSIQRICASKISYDFMFSTHSFLFSSFARCLNCWSQRADKQTERNKEMSSFLLSCVFFRYFNKNEIVGVVYRGILIWLLNEASKREEKNRRRCHSIRSDHFHNGK